jgi:hypothetical protein
MLYRRVRSVFQPAFLAAAKDYVARVYRVSGQAEPKMVDFENRNGMYVLVDEYRKRRKPPFAGRHHLKTDTP